MKIITFILIPLLAISLYTYSQNYSTWGEIYDYDVGDEFHREYYFDGHSHGTWYRKISNLLVTNKVFSLDSNSVTYTFFSQEIVRSQENPSWVYSSEYFEDTYDNLNMHFIADCTYYAAIYNGRKISFRDTLYVGYIWFLTEWKYVDGCGLANYYYATGNGGSHEIYDSLLYFRKGDETWGIPYILTGTDEFGKDSKNINIFPNPAGDRIQLSADKNMIIEKVRIFDQIGNMAISLSSEFNNIDISILSPGLYIVEVVTEKGRVCRKLVVE